MMTLTEARNLHRAVDDLTEKIAADLERLCRLVTDHSISPEMARREVAHINTQLNAVIARRVNGRRKG